MDKIEITVECPSCNGTGLYCGMAEGVGVGVVCHKCSGTGAYKYSYSYNEFTVRKTTDKAKRVYLGGMGYKIGLGKITYENGIGEIDMDREGVSYAQFLNGEMPEHIKQFGCPMMADQGACHDKKGFTEECNRLNGGWISYIPNCKNNHAKEQCWRRFKE